MNEKKKKRGRGQPTKRNPELEQRIFDDIEGGMGKDKAAILNGIAASTLHVWENKYPDFSEGIKEATMRFEKNQLLVIRRAAVDQLSRDGSRLLRRGSWVAAAWLLERKLHGEYGQRWAGELSGKGGKPLIPDSSTKVDTSRFTKEQLDKLIVATTAMMKLPHPTSPTNGSNGSNGNGTNGNGAKHP